MDDYISREEAIETVISYEFENCPDYMRDFATKLKSAVCSDIRTDLQAIPTADVVEVVRCKDCKWCHSGYCERFDDLIPFGLNTIEWENWFCADGERRADNG